MKDAIIEVGEIDGEFDVSLIRWSYNGGTTWNQASIAELITAFEKEQEHEIGNSER